MKIHRVACYKRFPLARSPQVHLCAVNNCTSALQMKLIQPKTRCRNAFSGWPSSVNTGQTVLLVVITSQLRCLIPLCHCLFETGSVWGWSEVSGSLLWYFVYFWGIALNHPVDFLCTHSWLCSSCHPCLCFVCLCRVCNCLTSLDKMHQPQFLSLRHSQCGTHKLDASTPVPFHPRPRPPLCTGQSEWWPRHSCVVWRLDCHGKVCFLLFPHFTVVPVKRFTRGSLKSAT